MTVLSAKIRGGFPVDEHTIQTKEVSWEHEQVRYVIHNVPFKKYENFSSEKVYESDVTLKLLLLKDLMESGEIPTEIDFQIANDIQLQ